MFNIIILRSDAFGIEPHHAIQWTDAAGNYHFGWIPTSLWDHLERTYVKQGECLLHPL